MFGILIDVTKCTGCERCVAACIANEWRSIRWQADRDRAVTSDGLSEHRPSTVLKVAEWAICPEELHALSRTELRFGLPGGGIDKDPGGAGGLRPRQVHRLPLLHAGLPLPRSPIRVGQDGSVHGEVRHVLQPAVRATSRRPAWKPVPEKALTFGDRDATVERRRAR